MVGKFSVILKRESLEDIAFCYIFRDNSKIVVSKSNKSVLEVLHVSSNVDFVPERYGTSKTMNAVTREVEMRITNN